MGIGDCNHASGKEEFVTQETWGKTGESYK